MGPEALGQRRGGAFQAVGHLAVHRRMGRKRIGLGAQILGNALTVPGSRIEQCVDGIGYRPEGGGAVGQRALERIRRALQSVHRGRHRVGPPRRGGQRLVQSRGGLGGQVGRMAREILAGASERAVERKHPGRVVEGIGHLAHMIGHHRDAAVPVVLVGEAGNRFGQRERHLGERLSEHGIHLVGHRVGSLIGDLRRDGALLLVGVVDDIGVARVARVEGEHVAAEALRDHHGGVVAPRLRAVDGVLLVGDVPVDLVVGPQGGDHLVADVDAQRDEVALVALVGVGHGHREVARVVEDVPAGDDVVPGEQRGHENEAQRDDDGHDVGLQAAQIEAEQAPDVIHDEPPPLPHHRARHRGHSRAPDRRSPHRAHPCRRPAPRPPWRRTGRSGSRRRGSLASAAARS